METNETNVATNKEPYLIAEGLGHKSPLGTPFMDVNMQVPLGSLLAIVGDHNTGKTALLLTLAFRMGYNRGSLSVGGYRKAGKVRKIASMALFKGLNDMEQHLKCRTVAASELDFHKKPHHREDVRAYLEQWGLGHICEMKVSALSEPDLIRFSIALGMINDPKLLVVDDVEHSLTNEQTTELMDLLTEVAHTRNMIVAVALTEPSYADGRADYVVSLNRSE